MLLYDLFLYQEFCHMSNLKMFFFFHLKHRNGSGFLHHLRHGLHLLALLGGVLVVVRVPQVAPEIPATIRVGSIGFYLGEHHDDVVGVGQGKEASLSDVAVTYPLPRLEKLLYWTVSFTECSVEAVLWLGSCR